MSRKLLWIGLAIAGMILGAAVSNWQRGDDGLSHLPDFTLPAVDGSPQYSQQWRGKIRVINFWASWCPPCREETPLFVHLQQEFADQDVQFIGIAIDNIEPVQAFIGEFAINYPVLLGGQDAIDLSVRLGNQSRGLPFTVISDRQGKIVMRHTGGLEEDRLRPVLERMQP